MCYIFIYVFSTCGCLHHSECYFCNDDVEAHCADFSVCEQLAAASGMCACCEEECWWRDTGAWIDYLGEEKREDQDEDSGSGDKELDEEEERWWAEVSRMPC